MQPSIARTGMVPSEGREIDLTVARRDGGTLKKNIDTNATRVAYPSTPPPSSPIALERKPDAKPKGNYLGGMAKLSVDPSTGFGRMNYADGVEMTPAREAFQKGMNLTMDQGPNRNPQAAQDYFTQAYRHSQGDDQLSRAEKDRIQQKAMDTRMNNMSLRAGTQVPYYKQDRKPDGSYREPGVGKSPALPSLSGINMGGGSLSMGREMNDRPSSAASPNQTINDFIRSEAAAQGVAPPAMSQPSSAAPSQSSANASAASLLKSAAANQPYSTSPSPAPSPASVPAPPVTSQQGVGKGVFNYQTYRSSNGQFSQDAAVMGIRDGNAVMQYPNGTVRDVPLDKLDGPSRERAIAASSARDFVRGFDADGMQVSGSDSMNRMFGGRDRNELYSSVTGRMTAGDPDGYTRQQAFNSAYGMAPPENPAIDESLVRQSASNARNRFAKATQPGGLPDIPDEDPTRPLLAPRGSAYYNPDDPRNRRAFRPQGDLNPGDTRDLGGGVSTLSNVTRRTTADNNSVVMGGDYITLDPATGLPMQKGSMTTDGATVAMLPGGKMGSLGGTRYAQIDRNGNVVGQFTPPTQTAGREMEAQGLNPNSQSDFREYLSGKFQDAQIRRQEREKEVDEIRSMAGGLGPGMGQRTAAARREIAVRNRDEQREDDLRQDKYSREDSVRDAEFDQKKELLDMEYRNQQARLDADAKREKDKRAEDRSDVVTAQQAAQGDPRAQAMLDQQAGFGSGQADPIESELYQRNRDGFINDRPNAVSPASYEKINKDQKDEILNYLLSVAEDPNLSDEAKKREWRRFAGTPTQFRKLMSGSSMMVEPGPWQSRWFEENYYNPDLLETYDMYAGASE